MRRTYLTSSGFCRTALRLAVLTAACLPTASADAQTYVYDSVNIVNMPGAACRTERFAREISQVSHDRITRVRANIQSYTRLLCPIPRRGTSHYGSAFTYQKANPYAVIVRGYDGDPSRTVLCYTFTTDRVNQTTLWGASRFLCSSSAGCSTPTGSYIGTSQMNVSPPTNGSSLNTVN